MTIQEMRESGFVFKCRRCGENDEGKDGALCSSCTKHEKNKEPGWWTLPVAESCWSDDAWEIER